MEVMASTDLIFLLNIKRGSVPLGWFRVLWGQLLRLMICMDMVYPTVVNACLRRWKASSA